jgi:thiol-disulfide isomerase/thioredoxin
LAKEILLHTVDEIVVTVETRSGAALPNFDWGARAGRRSGGRALAAALGFVLLLPGAIRPAAAQCEPAPAVREVLAQVYALEELSLPRQVRSDRARALVDAGLAEHGGDYFLLHQRMLAETAGEARVRWAASMRERHEGDPVFDLLAAEAMEGHDTPEALRRLAALAGAHDTDLPRVHLELATALSHQKFGDKVRSAREVARFLALCPAPLDGSALAYLQRLGTPEELAGLATAVRARLATEGNGVPPDVWVGLWRLELAAGTGKDPAAIRERIAGDLRRLEQDPRRPQLEFLVELAIGSRLALDVKAAERLDEEILTSYPQSAAARSATESRWFRQHPAPAPGSPEALAYQREVLQVTESWRRRWPDDDAIARYRFEAVAALPESSSAQVLEAGEELVRAHRVTLGVSSQTPVEFLVADAFLRRGVGLERVPGLVEEGMRSAETRLEAETANDWRSADALVEARLQTERLRLERLRLLIAVDAALGEKAKLDALRAELGRFDATVPLLREGLLARKAQLAEAQGRPMDALLEAQAALALAATLQETTDTIQRLQGEVERLWKGLGGTEETSALLVPAGAARPPQGDADWRAPAHALPAFSLSDLAGRTWTLASLRGKTVVIDVWATWCVPCQKEQPQLQQLYEALRGREDVVLLTFNVDADRSRVAPYMKERGYTFPVLFAGEVVPTVAPEMELPRTWLVSPAGTLDWERVGVDSGESWRDAVSKKLRALGGRGL